MSETQPDPLTAYLEQARSRATSVNYAIATDGYRLTQLAVDSTSDVARLLAAVEAVQVLASEWDIAAVRIAGEIEQVSPRNQGARILLEVRSELRLIQARAVREAISRALLGEGETDGH